MTPNEYQIAALRTANKNLTQIEQLENGLMGLNGEAGECIDLMKKHLFQGHDLSKEHVAKELGDIAWYLAVSADAIGYDLETVFQMNVDKLKARYPEGFDSNLSVHRKTNDIQNDGGGRNVETRITKEQDIFTFTYFNRCGAYSD